LRFFVVFFFFFFFDVLVLSHIACDLTFYEYSYFFPKEPVKVTLKKSSNSLSRLSDQLSFFFPRRERIPLSSRGRRITTQMSENEETITLVTPGAAALASFNAKNFEDETRDALIEKALNGRCDGEDDVKKIGEEEEKRYDAVK